MRFDVDVPTVLRVVLFTIAYFEPRLRTLYGICPPSLAESVEERDDEHDRDHDERDSRQIDPESVHLHPLATASSAAGASIPALR